MPDSSEQRVGPAPAGAHRLSIYFTVNHCAMAIEYYREAFGAQLVNRIDGPDGSVIHAELLMGGYQFQISDPRPDLGILAPPVDGNNFMITFWTEDVDEMYAAAIDEGGTAITPLADVFSGQRMGVVRCPFGVRWCIARHDRDVSTEQVGSSVRRLMSAEF
jgi:PhnB protein